MIFFTGERLILLVLLTIHRKTLTVINDIVFSPDPVLVYYLFV
jgi:hypothetical protein